MFETKPGQSGSKTPDDMKLLRCIITGTKGGKKRTYEIETDMHHHPWGLSNGHLSVGFLGAITAKMPARGDIKEKVFLPENR